MQAFGEMGVVAAWYDVDQNSTSDVIMTYLTGVQKEAAYAYPYVILASDIVTENILDAVK